VTANLPATASDIEAKRRIDADPLAKTIQSVTNAMKADYGTQFDRLFKTEADLTEFKRRFYKRVRGKELGDIADGYEAYVDAKNKYMPNLEDLMIEIDEIETNRRRREQNQAEAERVAALPAPKIECNPLEMLAEAKKSKTGTRTREECLKAHDALLTLHAHLIKHIEPDHFHSCEVGFCRKPGSISTNPKGGPYYCLEHYKIAG
jgi:hypothetical protein